MIEGVSQRTPPPVTWRTKALYGSGAIAYGIKDFGFNFFLLFFYSQVIGLPANWVSAALMLALIVDAVIDLFIGHISDNWRSRLGRRHPFMYAAALPAALSFALLWNPPHLPPETLFIYFVVLTVGVRTFIALYEIPGSALVPELTRDYNERTSFFSYRFLFAYLGGIGLIQFSLAVLFKSTPTYPVGQLNPAGYSYFGVLAGLAILTSILIATIGTHRRIPYFSVPPARERTGVRQAFREVRHTLSNRSFATLIVASIAANVATGLTNGLVLYITTYFWQLSAAQFAMLLQGSLVGSLLGPLIAPVVSKHFGKKKSGISLAMMAVVVGMAPFLLRFVGWFPANSSGLLVLCLLGVGVIATALGVAASVILAAMLADTVEDSEIVTGRRSEGLVLASNTFSNKCGSGLGIFISGLLVSAVNLPAHADPGSVDPAVINNLIAIFLSINTVLYLTWIVLFSRYRITREGHEQNLKRLAERAKSGHGVGTEPIGQEMPARLDSDERASQSPLAPGGSDGPKSMESFRVSPSRQTP